MVTGKYQVVSRMVKDAKYLKYTDVSDDILHSIWMEMDLKGIHTSVQKLGDIVTSDYSQPFNPLDHYLRSLPKWDGKTDYIREFAMRITVEDRPEYCHTQEEFVEYFRKWFVSMVVAWVNPHFVNQSMLILVGKGGIYKTTILGALLPPCLKTYYLNDSTSNYLDKDAMEAQATKASVNLDEFEAIFGRNLSAFKSNMTKEVFSFRRPYDKYRSELEHRASLCGTSNQQHIITDVENRRFSPWIVTKIVSPREKAINYEGLYSQALALGQSVSKGIREDGWVYWQTFEDVEKMRKHNRLFMVSNFAEEQILRFFVSRMNQQSPGSSSRLPQQRSWKRSAPTQPCARTCRTKASAASWRDLVSRVSTDVREIFGSWWKRAVQKWRCIRTTIRTTLTHDSI